MVSKTYPSLSDFRQLWQGSLLVPCILPAIKNIKIGDSASFDHTVSTQSSVPRLHVQVDFRQIYRAIP